MARLKSRLQCYGGFYFRDPQINTKEALQDWAFNTLVNRIIAQRQANPRFGLSTDQATVENELEQQNVQRLMSLRNQGVNSQFIVEEGGPASAVPFQPAAAGSPQPRLAVAAGKVAKVIRNAAVLTDWLGSGGAPVSQEVAEGRAAVCVACPKNLFGDYARWFMVPAANAIRRALEARQDLKLATPFDDRLGVCDVCLCVNKLKCWTPLEHIRDKSAPEVIAELATVSPQCWVSKELAG